ncbi:hypothetical protein RGQ29_032094 [Quercus rubra]|uniref:Uncharacterized protein n=1 Tax=Quercus rubra TaxID=3512 RepID=A0AAN7HXF7_QUERU|nr:hypothetical protein RGQ29_032094 [Quercus rubra]
MGVLVMGSTHGMQVILSLIFMMVIFALSFPEIAGQTILSSGFITGRNLLQTDNVLEPIRQSDDTVRVDPLDHFKKYRGGYNITNKHYWSSTIFTGSYGYFIGVLWLLCGLVYGGFLLANIYCSKTRKSGKLKKRSPCHRQCYLWHILVVISLTVLAIAASGLVLAGSAKFRSQAKTVVNIIINTANEASETIHNTTEAMNNIANNLETSSENSDTSSFLTSTSKKLDDEAADIKMQAKKNRRLIDKGLQIVYILTTFIISLNLVAVIALSGVGLSKSVLFDVSVGIYSLVNEVNLNISVLQATSYPNLVHVCNPFSSPPKYRYQPDNCPADTIRIGDIPKVLKLLTCSEANNATCEYGFISNTDYKTVESYSSSVQNLLNAYPGMESLVECQSVKDAFSEILLNHCKPLKRNVQMVWVSMVFLSMIMVNHEKDHHFSDGSVKPNLAKANMLDAGTAKEINCNPNSSVV